jgi:phosphoglycerol transferase
MEKKKGSKKKRIVTVLVIIFAGLAAFLALAAAWIMNTWTNLTMDELMYQLSAPTTGTNTEMYWDAAKEWLIPTALIIVAFCLIFYFLRHRRVLYKVMIALTAIAAAVTMVMTKNIFWDTLEVDAYLDYQKNPSTFIEDTYVDPADVTLTFPETKRNVIYIYLESMEVTYSDYANGGSFQEDVIPELTEMAQTYEDFSGSKNILNGAYSLPYTTFTMGAMFAQTSGLPLKNNVGNNDMSTQDHFFSSITSFGDILEDNGYHNVLMLGSDATFGGRRLYFTEHGNYDIMDYYYAKKMGWIDQDYKVWWGYEDEKLFSFAKDELNELSSSDEPFNLTLLTVDTHFEDGYVCELCKDEYDDRYANVMACSSRQVTEFIAWCQTQSWYDNTTIVICGDHPTMDSNFCDSVDSDYQRRAYVCYINSAVDTTSTEYRTYSTLDAFPTTLAAMGVQIEGNRLGLGVNLFSDEPTIIEEYGLSYVTEEIEKKSTFMEELADIDFSDAQLQANQSSSYHEDHTDTVYDTDEDSE